VVAELEALVARVVLHLHRQPALLPAVGHAAVRRSPVSLLAITRPTLGVVPRHALRPPLAVVVVVVAEVKCQARMSYPTKRHCTVPRSMGSTRSSNSLLP